MKMQRMWILSAGMTLLASILLGQGTHPAPTFEVASIEPAPPFSLEKMMSGQVQVGKISGSRVDFWVRVAIGPPGLRIPRQGLSDLRPRVDARWPLGY
jgi:hypothetical protein